jgi:hypothetical protein
MKHRTRFTIITLALLLTILISVPESYAQESSTHRHWSAEGDTVYLILNHIKADKKEQFDKWSEWWGSYTEELVSEGLLSDKEIEGINKMRLFIPFRMNKDTTYTYAYFADPYVRIPWKLRYYMSKKLSEEEISKYIKMFNDCFAGNQEGYRFIQAEYNKFGKK